MKKVKKKIAAFVILFPLIFHPLTFCPYSIPFVFCAVCPVRGIQGANRWWIALGIVLINLKKRFFCTTLCPCGSIQDGLGKVKLKKVKLPRWVRLVKYAIFIAAVSAVILIKRFLNLAPLGRVALYLTGVVFLTSLCIFRPWCRLFCPIDSASGLVDKIKT